MLSWKDFFVAIYSSDVFTWYVLWIYDLISLRGESPSRTGHFDCDSTESLQLPRLLDPLHQKCVNFIGKTAEVGSIAKSQNGETIYYWGRHSGRDSEDKINSINISELSPIPGDIVVDCSCGHDSGFLVVTKSGKVYNKMSSWYNTTSRWHDVSELFADLLNNGISI